MDIGFGLVSHCQPGNTRAVCTLARHAVRAGCPPSSLMCGNYRASVAVLDLLLFFCHVYLLCQVAKCGLARETGCSNRTALGNAADPGHPGLDVVLARALEVLRSAVSVGVMEHYSESVCLARAKIAQVQ